MSAIISPGKNESGALCGIITRGDLLRTIEEYKDDPNMTVIDAGNRNLIVAYPHGILFEAIDKMMRNDIGRLPVVDREHPRQVVGYLGRAGGHDPRGCIVTERSMNASRVGCRGWRNRLLASTRV